MAFYLIALAPRSCSRRCYPRASQPEISSGGAGGIRVGYQVSGVAGFDGFFPGAPSLFTPDRRTIHGRRLHADLNRIGADLRLMTPRQDSARKSACFPGWQRGLDSLGFERQPGCTPVESVTRGLRHRRHSLPH
jgi:hypothetical protein